MRDYRSWRVFYTKSVYADGPLVTFPTNFHKTEIDIGAEFASSQLDEALLPRGPIALWRFHHPDFIVASLQKIELVIGSLGMVAPEEIEVDDAVGRSEQQRFAGVSYPIAILVVEAHATNQAFALGLCVTNAGKQESQYEDWHEE